MRHHANASVWEAPVMPGLPGRICASKCLQMKTATVREAQHHLSRLLAEVEKGEEIVLTRRGKQVGILVPVRTACDPFERKVDWSESIRERNENLRELQPCPGNAVVEMREEERY